MVGESPRLKWSVSGRLEAANNELCERRKIYNYDTVNSSPVARAFRCKKSNTARSNLVVQKSKSFKVQLFPVLGNACQIRHFSLARVIMYYPFFRYVALKMCRIFKSDLCNSASDPLRSSLRKIAVLRPADPGHLESTAWSLAIRR